MARRRRADRRDVLPDTKYKSEDLNRFINYVMFHGKIQPNEDGTCTLSNSLGLGGKSVTITVVKDDNNII